MVWLLYGWCDYFSITKLDTLSRTLPSTAEEVDETAERYQTLIADTSDALHTITENYESHHSLDQALTHVEGSMSDLEDRIKSLNHDKTDTELMNDGLQVCLHCTNFII